MAGFPSETGRGSACLGQCRQMLRGRGFSRKLQAIVGVGAGKVSAWLLGLDPTTSPNASFRCVRHSIAAGFL